MNYKLHIFRDKKREHRWHVKAHNGRIVACSGEGFSSKTAARHSWNVLRRNIERNRVEEVS